MQIEVPKLRPNPFRDMKRYPINEDKVKALVASIEATSFWDNLVCRPAGDHFELAYGHHRLAALKKAHIESVDISVRDLDDETMLRMMAHENMDEWGATAEVMQETVRAVVLAYAERRIELPPPPPNTPKKIIRYAPGFAKDSELVGKRTSSDAYTGQTIADWLSWSKHRVDPLLDLLALEEAKLVAPDDTQGLNQTAVEMLVSNIRHYESDLKAAKAVGKDLSTKLKDGTLTTGSLGRERAKEHAAIVAAEHGYRRRPKKPKELPNQDSAAYRLADEVEKKGLSPATLDRCQQIASVAKDVTSGCRTKLAKAIRKRMEGWAEVVAQLEQIESAGDAQRYLSCSQKSDAA